LKETIIIRHRRENLKKCSLRGLEGRKDLLFYTYPEDPLPNLEGYLLLKVGAPPLSEADKDKGILLIDGTWKLASLMEKQLPMKLEERSLPGLWQTAYPRRQTDCPDPNAGLSSVEALFLTYRFLGRSTEGLLDQYYWKDLFYEINHLQY
jgi:pre-rRNA-processing protein TSR3